MPKRRLVSLLIAATLLALAQPFLAAQVKLAPLVYTIRFPEPASKTFTVEIAVPTDKRESVDLMMAIWSPGLYGIQNYADRVSGFTHRPAEVRLELPQGWYFGDLLPGRLVQALDQSSSQMFERIDRDKKVDYYVKGPVVGLILDAHTRKMTSGRPWTLEVRPDATVAEKAHFAAFMAHSKAR